MLELLALIAAAISDTGEEADRRARLHELRNRLGVRKVKITNPFAKRLIWIHDNLGRGPFWFAASVVIRRLYGPDFHLRPAVQVPGFTFSPRPPPYAEIMDRIIDAPEPPASKVELDPFRLLHNLPNKDLQWMLPYLPWLGTAMNTFIEDRLREQVRRISPAELIETEARKWFCLPDKPYRYQNRALWGAYMNAENSLFHIAESGLPEIFDWIEADRPDLSNVTLLQASELASEWHDDVVQLETARRTGKRTESLAARPVVASWPDGWTLTQLMTPADLDDETALVEHCIGVGGYDHRLRAGHHSYYSLHDPKGSPKVTYEIQQRYLTNPIMLLQMRGRRNMLPSGRVRWPALRGLFSLIPDSDYWPRRIFKTLTLDDVSSAIREGIAKLDEPPERHYLPERHSLVAKILHGPYLEAVSPLSRESSRRRGSWETTDMYDLLVTFEQVSDILAEEGEETGELGRIQISVSSAEIGPNNKLIVQSEIVLMNRAGGEPWGRWRVTFTDDPAAEIAAMLTAGDKAVRLRNPLARGFDKAGKIAVGDDANPLAVAKRAVDAMLRVFDDEHKEQISS